MSALVAIAERLRQEHLARHDVTNALPWDLLQPSEQQRWLDEARRAQEAA